MILHFGLRFHVEKPEEVWFSIQSEPIMAWNAEGEGVTSVHWFFPRFRILCSLLSDRVSWTFCSEMHQVASHFTQHTAQGTLTSGSFWRKIRLEIGVYLKMKYLGAFGVGQRAVLQLLKPRANCLNFWLGLNSDFSYTLSGCSSSLLSFLPPHFPSLSPFSPFFLSSLLLPKMCVLSASWITNETCYPFLDSFSPHSKHPQ